MKTATVLLLIAVFALLPSPAESTCGDTIPLLTASNTLLTWTGGGGQCTPSTGPCAVGMDITFSVQTFGVDLSCANHTFDWNFGDGTTSTTTAPMVSHRYLVPGTYAVSVRVTGADTLQLDGTPYLTLTRTLSVAAPIPALSPAALVVFALCLGTIGLLLSR